jgi:hypothetical protein
MKIIERPRRRLKRVALNVRFITKAHRDLFKKWCRDHKWSMRQVMEGLIDFCLEAERQALLGESDDLIRVAEFIRHRA